LPKFISGKMSNEVTRDELESFEKDNIKRYSNEEITVYWRPGLCIHSANCLTGSPLVFNMNRRPWISLKGATTEELIKTIDTCPSRALVYRKIREEPIPPSENKPPSSGNATIRILKDGPALISGDFLLQNSEKQPIETKSGTIALCRCGSSAKKPFCDGSHVRIGFKD